MPRVPDLWYDLPRQGDPTAVPTRPGLVALVAGAFLAIVPAAYAGAPFKLAPEPSRLAEVAVDGVGTAHVVWHPNAGSVRYCAVPPAATSCDPASLRTLTGAHAGDDGNVLVAPNGIVVIYAVESIGGGDGLFWTSADGFASTTRLPDITGDDMALGPGPSFLSVSADGVFYERIPGSGTAAFTDAPFTSIGAAFDRAGKQVAANDSGALVVRWGPPRAGTGPDSFVPRVEWNTYAVASGADPNRTESWSAGTTVKGINPVVAGGPQGIVILYGADRIATAPLRAIRIDSSLASSGPRVAGGYKAKGTLNATGDLWASPVTGAFAALFRAADGLRLTVSADGLSWTRASLVVGDAAFRGTRPGDTPAGVAAAPDGSGLAVWAGKSGVFAARLTKGRGGGGPVDPDCPKGTSPGVSCEGPDEGGLWDIIGTAASDRIVGTRAEDRIRGRGGADRINGRGNSDDIRGGRGKDKINGSAGDDFLYGDAGKDLIKGGKGRDDLFGGKGRDRLNCGPGDDLAVGSGDAVAGNCERRR